MKKLRILISNELEQINILFFEKLSTET